MLAEEIKIALFRKIFTGPSTGKQINTVVSISSIILYNSKHIQSTTQNKTEKTHKANVKPHSRTSIVCGSIYINTELSK
jgi:hypothetical protein